MKAVVAAAVVLTLAAQQPPPTFRAATRLVELTVTALDKKGNPVTDLRADDFTIQDNGKLRPITFFKYDGEPAAVTQPPLLPPDVFTNRVELSAGPPRNVTAFVLDELNTPAVLNMRVRATAMRYLKALRPGNRMAVFYLGTRLRVLHDFTDDAASLRARIDKALLAVPLQNETDINRSIIEAEQFVDMFEGDPVQQAIAAEMKRTQIEQDMQMNAQLRRSRLERTLASLEALGDHLAGIPGRKSLVWISGGISMLSVTGAMGTGTRGSIESYEAQVKRTSRQLAQQGIVLYIVDAKGLEVSTMTSAESAGVAPLRGRGRFEPQQDAETISGDAQPAMQMLSSITGGRYLYNSNDLMDGFRKAASDLDGSYTLGFYVAEYPDDKWHTLKAGVKRPGVSVRHRQGYLSETDAARSARWTADESTAVITRAVGASAVQLTAACGPAPGEPGVLVLKVRIEVSSLLFRMDGQEREAQLQLIFAEREPDGTTRKTTDSPTVMIGPEHWAAAEQEGLLYTHRWKPARDALSMRIVVRDMASGQFGTLDVPLTKVPR